MNTPKIHHARHFCGSCRRQVEEGNVAYANKVCDRRHRFSRSSNSMLNAVVFRWDKNDFYLGEMYKNKKDEQYIFADRKDWQCTRAYNGVCLTCDIKNDGRTMPHLYSNYVWRELQCRSTGIRASNQSTHHSAYSHSAATVPTTARRILFPNVHHYCFQFNSAHKPILIRFKIRIDFS